MRVSLKSTAGVVSFVDTSTKIVSITDAGVLYRISLSVNVSKALKNEANIIDVVVYAEDPDTFKVTQPGSDAAALTKAILHSSSDQKSAALIRKNKVIASTRIDITTKVDNSRIAAIKAGRPSDTATSALEVSTLQKTQVTSANTSQSSRLYSAASILQAGVDPSEANRKLTQTISASKVMQGTSVQASTQYETGLTSRLQDLVFSPTIQSSAVGRRQSLSRKTDTKMTGDVLIPSSTLSGQSHFFVVARLTSAQGRTVSEAKTRVDHTASLKIFNTPKLAPEVTLTAVHGQGHLNFEIRQLDANAVKVGVYRRVVGHVDLSALNGGYEKLAELNVLPSSGRVKFSDTSPGTKIAIYRFTAVGSTGTQSSDFSSVVYRPATRAIKSLNRRTIFRTVTITTQNIDDGMSIELSSLPASARAIGVLRRDLTINEKVLSFIDAASPIVRIDDPTTVVSFTDTTTKPDHVYEYACRMYTRDGSEYPCVGSAIVKRTVASGTGIQLTISNVAVNKSTSSSDIMFKLKSATGQDTLNKTFEVLAKSDLSSVYSTEIESGKSDLSDLITHNVTRVDTVTGEIADFGTIIGEDFSDIGSRTSSITTDVVPGRKYRYVVSTQLRSADSLLSERTIEKTDVFGRSWSYKPKKYLNPITLKTGTLLPNDMSMVHHPEEEFKLGALGNESFIEVTLPGDVTSLTRTAATRVQGRGVIKWALAGEPTSYDYFEVFSVVDGTVKPIGRTQCTGASSYEFISPDSDEEAGKFVIVPVMTDFTQGTYVTVDVV